MPLILLLLLLSTVPLWAAPIISEFSSAGQGVVMDEDDDFPDWIELFNPDEVPYTLTDHFLTDDPSNLTKWMFPRGEQLRAGNHRLIFASRKDTSNIFVGTVHTNFALASNDGFIALVAPDGATIVHQWEAYPKQRAGLSYGIGEDGVPGYFAAPTPGEANGEALPTIVADTKFSVDRGFYEEPIRLMITTATEGASIYFTLDGSAPSPKNGTLFESPLDIEETTIVRAMAVKEGMIATDVDTQSYLFLASVLTQSDSPDGFPNRWGSVPADYAFDTSVGTTEEFRRALLDYPSISLVMSTDAWFDPSRQAGVGGIYANSLGRGLDWEKAVSAEFLNFAGEPNAQVDCGIRIYGNASRQTSRPKHNMRLAFRARYGAAKLDFPVFGKGQATGINGLLFNGQNGDSWFHPTIGQRQAASYLRDHFAHELLGEMGHLTPPQARAHLYVNGLYWGFYQTIERVDQHFMARLLGGEPEEYDSMKASNTDGPTLVAGDTRAYEELFAIADAGVADADGYAAIQEHLHLDSFIDYMLINFWTGNRDWDHNNWRSGRHRSAGSPWHYFMWDSENIFKEDGIDRTTNNTADNPTRLHQQLAKNAAYRLKFADSVQRHLFQDGLLTLESVRARWERWAAYIRPGLKAESARWGDHHRSGNPHTVEDDFEAAYAQLMDTRFPARARNVIRQFEARDLYPTHIQPVEFHQHGGPIEEGFVLRMFAGSLFEPQDGAIHFTLDGTDPMDGPGTLYEAAVPLTQSTTVKARILDEEGRWSPLTEARFTLGQAPQVGELLLSEIHYHPAAPTPEEDPEGQWSRTDFEFVEIWNVAERTLQLQGLSFDEGIRFTFPEAILEPGARALVIEDREAFVSRYGNVPTVLGEYQGQLSNGGEQVTLRDATGSILHTLFYDDESPWPTAADGEGFSLELTTRTASESADGWETSVMVGGTPGSGTDALPTDANFPVSITLDGIHVRADPAAWEIVLEGSDDLLEWSVDARMRDETSDRWTFPLGERPSRRYFRFRLTPLR